MRDDTLCVDTAFLFYSVVQLLYLKMMMHRADGPAEAGATTTCCSSLVSTAAITTTPYLDFFFDDLDSVTTKTTHLRYAEKKMIQPPLLRFAGVSNDTMGELL